MSVITGHGLHTGGAGSVRFVRSEGPVRLRAGGRDVELADLRAGESRRSTRVTDAGGALRLVTVEHVLAALGGLGIHDGVTVVIEGDEPPLADGGARLFVEALRALGAPSSAPPLRIARDGAFDLGTSRYAFEACAGVELEVHVDFDDARIAKEARWSGDADDFAARIAPARTFGFAHEVEDLMARGLASHVTPESVVVITRDGVLSAGAPFTADEPARHKLLDLVGDLFLYGGPPRGRLRTLRPGHAATHEVMEKALSNGLVVRDRR